MRITVETRTVYGLPKVYLVCRRADRFAAMAGTKTLTTHALDDIRALGFVIIDRTASASRLSPLLG